MLPLLPKLETALKELDSLDLVHQVRNYNEDIQQTILSYLKNF